MAHGRFAAIREWSRRYGDYVLAAMITAMALVDIWTNKWITGPKPLFTFLVLCMTIPLAWRRRFPLAVALIVSSAVFAQVALAPSLQPPVAPIVVWVIVTYSVAAHASLERALLGGLLMIASVDVWSVSSSPGQTQFVFLTIIFSGFWIAGRVVYSRNRLAEELKIRTQELEAEREETARLAVAEERARIARELHDVVAHTLSVIVVQAGAENLTTTDPQAREAFGQIAATGRSALGEMGRLLGMLRSDSDRTDLVPQPGLAGLPELIATVERAGLKVRLDVVGEPHVLPPTMDVSAYRIVQEGLTNSLKHSECTSVAIEINWSETSLQIEIADNGVGPRGNIHSGHGLIGLRERVALFHGTLVTGRGEAGGFHISALLPLPTS